MTKRNLKDSGLTKTQKIFKGLRALLQHDKNAEFRIRTMRLDDYIGREEYVQVRIFKADTEYLRDKLISTDWVEGTEEHTWFFYLRN